LWGCCAVLYFCDVRLCADARSSARASELAVFEAVEDERRKLKAKFDAELAQRTQQLQAKEHELIELSATKASAGYAVARARRLRVVLCCVVL
jgi:hypothetical protein